MERLIFLWKKKRDVYKSWCVLSADLNTLTTNNNKGHCLLVEQNAVYKWNKINAFNMRILMSQMIQKAYILISICSHIKSATKWNCFLFTDIIPISVFNFI